MKPRNFPARVLRRQLEARNRQTALDKSRAAAEEGRVVAYAVAGLTETEEQAIQTDIDKLVAILDARHTTK